MPFLPSPSMCISVYDPYFALCPGVSHRASPASVAAPPSFTSRAVPSLSSCHASWMTGKSTSFWYRSKTGCVKNSRPKQAAISATREWVSPVNRIAAEMSTFPIGTFFMTGCDCQTYEWPPWHSMCIDSIDPVVYLLFFVTG